MTADTEKLRHDFQEAFREFSDNKERAKELNSRNTELCKGLDEAYALEKGTTKEYFRKKLQEAEDKDRTESVLELEALVEK